METPKDEVLYTEADIIDANKEEDKELVKVPEFDEYGAAGENAPTFDELQEQGFFHNSEHPKDEEYVTVEMPRGLGKSTDISEEAIERFKKETPEGMVHIELGPPAEKESDYNHFSSKEEEPAEMINLQDILVELSKDYTLDNLNYPPIKLNMLRAIGVIKNISLDNKEEIVMNDDDWKRFYNNMTSYVNYINKGLDDVKAIIKAKQAEFNMAKTKLHGQHEDVKVIEDIIGPIETEIVNLKEREEKLSKELFSMKSLKTQVFAREKKFNRMFAHVQRTLTLAVLLKERIDGKTEILDTFCKDHDEDTKQKLAGYLDAIINDDYLLKDVEEKDLADDYKHLTENSLDEQMEQAGYFRQLATSTMFKLAEMFNWSIVVPDGVKEQNNDGKSDNKKLTETERENLMIGQISKKLMNVVNGTAPESKKFTKEDRNKIYDFIKFTDIFIGYGMENLVNSSTGIVEEFKKAAVQAKIPKINLLADIAFKDMDRIDNYKHRLMAALLFSVCKLDTLPIIFYMI